MSHVVKPPAFIFIQANLKAVTAAITKGNDALSVEEEQKSEWEGSPKDVIWKTPHLHWNRRGVDGGWQVKRLMNTGSMLNVIVNPFPLFAVKK